MEIELTITTSSGKPVTITGDEDEVDKIIDKIKGHAALTRQRDDLLAVLEELATAVKYTHMDSIRYTPGCTVCDGLARSDQVIAATGRGEVGA